MLVLREGGHHYSWTLDNSMEGPGRGGQMMEWQKESE